MMKIGIVGFPQTGKKILFKLLSGAPIDKELDAKRPLIGVAEIRDPRFDFLLNVYKPKKAQRARIDIALLPTIEKDAISSDKIFKDISDMDALVHVVRAFIDDCIYHINGSVDSKRDIKAINAEFVMADLIFLEKRLNRIETSKDKSEIESLTKEKALLLRLKEQLDKELPLRLLELEIEEVKTLASYPLLTYKEMIILLNVSEDDLKSNVLTEQLGEEFKPQNLFFMQACLKIESEIAVLDSEEERREFQSGLGIVESALDGLSRTCAKALGLISFFTVVSNEVRQWTIKKGASILEAAGSIHTDLQRGFIRAEVVKFSDLKQFGNEEAVKVAGKLSVKGKDYVVEDGDIIKIRFNV